MPSNHLCLSDWLMCLSILLTIWTDKHISDYTAMRLEITPGKTFTILGWISLGTLNIFGLRCWYSHKTVPFSLALESNDKLPWSRLIFGHSTSSTENTLLKYFDKYPSFATSFLPTSIDCHWTSVLGSHYLSELASALFWACTDEQILMLLLTSKKFLELFSFL